MARQALHFIGIGGIGMSAIARILLARGERVTGSDAKESETLSQLRAAGADVFVGHDARRVEGAREVIVSSAVGCDNPEYRAAQKHGIPIVPRGEMLARLTRGRRAIAVCGTHGKTTTTAMAAAILRTAGIDASVALGGISVADQTNAHDGSSPWFLTEADESDGSFALLDPEIAVVTNIENDHLTSDTEIPQLVDAFARFADKIAAHGTAIFGADNPRTAALASRSRAADSLTFGLSQPAKLRADTVRLAGFGSTFDARENGAVLGAVHLRIPGTMNVVNALGAIAIARCLEIPFQTIGQALERFSGVRRRFDIVASTSRMTVVDDYAHHPTAVAATIAAARSCQPGQLIVAFQPHRYTRTAYLADAFARALRGADRVYLTPVYAASEPAMDGVSERSIGEPLRASGTDVRYVASVGDLVPALLADAPPGSLVLMLGAGDITSSAAMLAAQLQGAS